MEITTAQVKEAIDRFLREQLQKKAEPELKKLEKLDPSSDAEKIAAARNKIAELEAKYALDNWMLEASTRLASQLRFGTHISKGVHPDSKGDNINFQRDERLPEGLVGSQTLENLPLDANGNAAALPLAALFDYPVNEDGSFCLGDLIRAEHLALDGVFSSDLTTSREHASRFKAALDNVVDTPSTHERNKQILWPLENAIVENQYRTLVPLYPSALTHSFYQKLNDLRFSEENKTARENRRKKNVEQRPYVSIPEIALVKLGGTKPQNVSQLTSRQGGRNYLLPSLPPLQSTATLYRLSTTQTTLFNYRLARHCRHGLNQLYAVVQAKENTIEVRKARQLAADNILHEIFALAAYLQQSLAPGWSREYQLSMPEKYWLDPARAELDGETAFREGRQNSNWHEAIGEQFALWLNDRLKKKFPKLAINIGDDEHREWQREMEDAIKASLRAGEELFA